MKNIDKKLKIKMGVILVLLTSLLVASSLAWQDVSQHKTNNFMTKPFNHSVVLVEDFVPVEDWKQGDTVKKEIFVRNGQDSDDPDVFDYNDGFVRVQLREFLGIAKQSVVLSDDRFMVDEHGEFYRYQTSEEAENAVKQMALTDPDDRIKEIAALSDEGIKHFYIKTYPTDKNGQYGKFLTLKIEADSLKNVINGNEVIGLDDDVRDKHDNLDSSSPNIEDTEIYTTHLWKENSDSLGDEASPFFEFVRWKLGDDVITLNTWITDYDARPVSKWILDTRDEGEGWAYWGQKLEHSTGDNPLSKTTLLLESVTLINQGDGTAQYRIHTNLDAVDIHGKDHWANAPQEIMDALF